MTHPGDKSHGASTLFAAETLIPTRDPRNFNTAWQPQRQTSHHICSCPRQDKTGKGKNQSPRSLSTASFTHYRAPAASAQKSFEFKQLQFLTSLLRLVLLWDTPMLTISFSQSKPEVSSVSSHSRHRRLAVSFETSRRLTCILTLQSWEAWSRTVLPTPVAAMSSLATVSAQSSWAALGVLNSAMPVVNREEKKRENHTPHLRQPLHDFHGTS